MENKKDSVVICPGAQVLGDVELGEDVSIWHGAVVRGDVDSIKIGNNSNVQDNCVLHCTVGAGAVVSEGKEFPEGSLILGVPGKLIKEVTPEQIEHIQENADNYKKLSKQYK